MAMSRPRTPWGPPVPPSSAVGTGHRFGEPVSMEGAHKGVDVQAVRGTPALSPIQGTITRTWNEPQGLGQQIGVRGPDGNEVRFAHLQGTSARPGQRVGQGQQIATVGSSGAGSTGPHLDVREIGPGGQYLDPTRQLGQMAQMPRADRPGAGQDPQPHQPTLYINVHTGDISGPASHIPPGGNSEWAPMTGPGATSMAQDMAWEHSSPAPPSMPPVQAHPWAGNQAFIDHFQSNWGVHPNDALTTATRAFAEWQQATLPSVPGYPVTDEVMPHWEGNWRRMAPGENDLTLFRGVYPGESGNAMGTQSSGPSGGTTWGNQGQWYTDDPQWGLLYGSDRRDVGHPQTTASQEQVLERLQRRFHIPSTQDMTQIPPGAYHQPSAESGLPSEPRPGGLYSVTLTPQEQAQTWVRQAPDWQPGTSGAPYEFLVPPHVTPRSAPRFMGSLGGLPGVAGGVGPLIEGVLPPDVHQGIEDAWREHVANPVNQFMQEHQPPSPWNPPSFVPAPAPEQPSTARDQWYNEQPSGPSPAEEEYGAVGGGQGESPSNWATAGGWGGGLPQTELPDPYWISQGFRPMDPATEPLRLYRGDYPGTEPSRAHPGSAPDTTGPAARGEYGTNYDGTTGMPSHGGRGGGQWFTDSPQAATTLYGTNRTSAPGTNDPAWQRLLPGINANWTRNNVHPPPGEPLMDPGLVTSLQVPANRVPDVLWRTAPQWQERHNDPSSAPAHAPREYIVPQDLLHQQMPRVRGVVPLPGVAGMAANFPQQFMENFVEPGMQAIGEWFNPPPAYAPGLDEEPSVGGGQDMKFKKVKNTRSASVGVGQFGEEDPLMGGGWMNQMPMSGYGGESQGGYGPGDTAGGGYEGSITPPYEPPVFGTGPTTFQGGMPGDSGSNWYDNPTWGGPRSDPFSSPQAGSMGGFGDSFAPMTPGGSGRFGAPSGYNYGSNYGGSAWNVPSPPGMGGFGGGGQAYTGGQSPPGGLGTFGNQASFPDLLSQGSVAQRGSPSGSSQSMGGSARSAGGGAQSQGGSRSGGNNTMPFDIPNDGVYGNSKWLPGSQGTDIFLRDNTPITAKTGGRVLYSTGGTALQGGADTIAQFDDGTVARFRHVQGALQAGQTFSAGQVIARIHDDSMNMLNPQVAGQIGAPSGYQHLDLSINPPGQTQFSPQGGGGGSVNAAQWLQQHGYGGRVVGRTPGPQEGQMGGMGGMGQGGFGGSMGQGGFPGMNMGMFGGGQDVGSGADLTGADPFSTQYPGPTNVPWPLANNSSVTGSFGQPAPAAGASAGGTSSLIPGVTTPSAVPAQGDTQVSNTTPAGTTGATMPEIKPLDMSTMTKLTPTPTGATGDTPWLQNHQSPTPVTHDPTDFSVLQPPPVVGPLGTQPYQTPYWLQPPTQKQPGSGQDVGAGAGLGKPSMSMPMFMAPRHGKLPMGGAEQTFQMMQPGHAEVSPPNMPRPRGGGMGGGRFRMPRPHMGLGQDVGVGQNSLTAGQQQGDPNAQGTMGSTGQSQVAIDPYSQATLQQEQQRLQLSQQQISGQLQQINNNYQVSLRQLEQQFQLTGDTNKLEQDRQRLQDAQFKDTQQLQMRLANIQMQQNALDRNLRQQEINNTFQTQMGQLQQQWMTHQDSQLLEQQKAMLQNQWNQQSNALALVQGNKQARLQLELQKGTLGFQQEQLGVNAGLSLSQLAAQTGLSQEQLRAQTGLGLTQLGQQAADQAANRQLSLYGSALSTPWVQQLTGLAPEYNAPGGPGETGYASAHGMQARADMSKILPGGQVPDYYSQIGSTQVNQHPDYLNRIGSTQVSNWNPGDDSQDYFNLLNQMGGQGDIFPSNNGFTGNFQNTWNTSFGVPTNTGTGTNPIDINNMNGMTWSPFTNQPLSTSTTGSTTGSTGGSSMPQFGLDFNPAGGGTMQNRPAGQNTGVTYNLPGGQNSFTSQNVWDYEQANPGISPDAAYQHFISQNSQYPGWNYGTNFPQGSNVQWNPSTATTGGDQGMGMQAPGQTAPGSAITAAPPDPNGNAGNYVGTGEDKSQGQHLGYLPPEVLAALKSNPEVGQQLVEAWVQERRSSSDRQPLYRGASSDYAPTSSGVGTGADVPFVQPFENPAYGNYVGAGADSTNPLTAPIGSTGTDAGSPYQSSGQGSQGAAAYGTSQPPAGSVQNSMDQAFGGGGGYGANGYGNQNMYAPRRLPPQRLQQGYNGQNYTPPQTASDPNWYAGWKQAYGGTTGGNPSPYDLNGDQTVDVRDWGMYQQQHQGGDAPTPPPNNTTGGGWQTTNLYSPYNPDPQMQYSDMMQTGTNPLMRGKYGYGNTSDPSYQNWQQQPPQQNLAWPQQGYDPNSWHGGPPNASDPSWIQQQYQQDNASMSNGPRPASFDTNWRPHMTSGQPPTPTQGGPDDPWYQGWHQAFGGTTGGNPSPYDLNNDQRVDVLDWGLYHQQHPYTPPPPGPPPNTDPNQFQTPVDQGEGYVPGPLFKPPSIPKIPQWEEFKAMTPFERSAFQTKVMMSGIPWQQFQDAMRAQWANPQGIPQPNSKYIAPITATPQEPMLAGINASQNPMMMTGMNQLADTFGEGPQAYWQRMQSQWAPGQSSGAMISG